MRGYVDHLLALLPFEPAAHARLGGPPCTYVGHPLVEQAASLRPDAQETARRYADPPRVLLLPGSRGVEVNRLLAIFMAAIDRLAAQAGPLDVVLPTVPHLRDRLAEATNDWPIRPKIVTDAAEKHTAFRTARVALAASGTVTLELAVAGIPTVVAYKVSRFEDVVLRPFVRVPSIVLANLVLGEDIMPEYVEAPKQPKDAQEKRRLSPTPENLADGLLPLLGDTLQRRMQVDAFNRLDAIMGIGALSPSRNAADIVLNVARRQHAD
jgi:lipid-A-disaccharide synthase